MIPIVKGETYNRTARVDGHVVTINHVSNLKDGPHYMTTKIDMSNMDGDEVLRHAGYNVLIQILRPRALKPYNSNQIDETKVLDPMDYPATRGGGISKRDMLVKLLVAGGVDQAKAEKYADNPELLAKALEKK